jgi:hypothetical protein
MDVTDVSRNVLVSFSSWCQRPSAACALFSARACARKEARIWPTAEWFLGASAERTSTADIIVQPLARPHLQQDKSPFCAFSPWSGHSRARARAR